MTGLRLFHQGNDLGQQGVIPHLFRPKGQRPGLVDGRPNDRIPDLLGHRQAFPGDHRFVDGRGPRHHRPVDGDFFPWFDLNQITNAHLSQRHRHGLAIAQDRGCFGLQLTEFANGIGGPVAHSFFKNLP